MLFLNHPQVRTYFLKNGHVYTLRSSRRKREGLQVIVHGTRFKHLRVGRGVVRLVKVIKLRPTALGPYVRRSGFKASMDWIAAYRSLNGGKAPVMAFLYQVKVSAGAAK